MLAALAVAPILTPVVLLLALRQSALRAGAAGLAVALVLVAFVPAYGLSGEALQRALLAGGLMTWMVAYVLLGGLVLYEVLRQAGALEAIAASVAELVPDPARRALILVFGLSVFFESATGFGIGVVVAAPLFVALGHRPRDAALLALAGQCAVTWGALAVGTVLGAELTGVSSDRLGMLAAPLSLPLILACGLAAAGWAAGWHALWRSLPEVLLYGTALVAVLFAASAGLGVETAGMIGGLAVTALGLVVSRCLRGPATQKRGKRTGDLSLARALAPFAILLVALLATRLIVPLGEGLREIAVLRVPGSELAVPLLYNPGFWLLATAAVSVALLRVPARAFPPLAGPTLRRWLTAALAVAGFLCFSQVMAASGMIAALATEVADLAGRSYIFALPLLGGLGGFLTASNAGSNAMFATFHAALGARLELPADWVAAAQNAAGANTTLASPGRVVLAAAVTGLAGREGELMRPVLVLAAIGLLGTVAIFGFAVHA